jgi:SAM-dependent methyltransferase
MKRYGPWRHALLAEIRPERGFAYIAGTCRPELSSHRVPSPAHVLEDGVPLSGPGNDLHDNIRNLGEGRFSFWHDAVYFSASDNTDPRTNGRRYEIAFPPKLLTPIAWCFRKAREMKNSLTHNSLPTENKPVNLSMRNFSPEAIDKDVAYAMEIGQNLVRWLPEGSRTLVGKTVLEIGPGINFGSPLLMACMGAHVTVSDRFLAPWDEAYHPRFYSLLRERIRATFSSVDLAPLDKILGQKGYDPLSIQCFATSLEKLEGIPDATMDIIFSIAVLEHLFDPLSAFRQMARVSKRAALGYHQVDFRDHNDFSKPLEFLLMGDQEFAKQFIEKHGECGNRYRPSDYHEMFQLAGFRVREFTSSCTADDAYLSDFIPRLRQANGSRYQNLDPAHLKHIGGRFTVERP